MVNRPKAVIFGCAGTELLPTERAFFERCQPLGFILFARNCKSPDQVRKLVQDLRGTVSHSDVPILIDQEGGRVVRLTPPIWRAVPSASAFGQLAYEKPDVAIEAVFNNAVLIGNELQDLGINVDCAPCVDLLISGSDPIIGDRAFTDHPETVAELSLAMIEGLQNQNVIPVIKHLPGHGRAPVDSHKELPIITTPAQELVENDFLAFLLLCENIKARSLPQPWGMTAHVVYQDFDDQETATHSSYIIDHIIRNQIGFEGFLISDCLTMEALEGLFSIRAQKALKSGCDAVLHCSGHLDEMIEVAGVTPPLTTLAWKRLESSKLPGYATKPLTKEELSTLQLSIEAALENSDQSPNPSAESKKLYA
jgi:beta-N-acetylhexosaminidase